MRARAIGSRCSENTSFVMSTIIGKRGILDMPENLARGLLVHPLAAPRSTCGLVAQSGLSEARNALCSAMRVTPDVSHVRC